MYKLLESTIGPVTRASCLVLGLAAAGIAVQPAMAQSVIKIRFAHSLSSTEPAHLAAEFFAKNVAERTGNRVQIQVFPSEQLGSGKEVNEMIRQGANVMNITDPGYMSDFVPDIGVLNGPYLIKDPADYQKLLDSDWFKGIEKKLEAAGFKLIMANGFFGQRHMIADKPVRKPEDVAGLTVRVRPTPCGLKPSRRWAQGLQPCNGRRSTARSSRTWWLRRRRHSARSGDPSCMRRARSSP
jgi:TRAP-type C4-dicarboxylate transport system substrate-binding protein